MGNIFQTASPVRADTPRQCLVTEKTVSNKVLYRYSTQSNSLSTVSQETFSNQVDINVLPQGTMFVSARGMVDDGRSFALGTFTGALNGELKKLGFTEEEANKSILAVTKKWKTLPTSPTFQQIALSSRNALIEAVPEKASVIENLGGSELEQATTLAVTVTQSVFEIAGLSNNQTELATKTALAIIMAAPSSQSLNEVAQAALDAMLSEQLNKSNEINQGSQAIARDFKEVRSANQTRIRAGDIIQFKYLLFNPGTTSTKVVLPNINSGSSQELTIPPRGQIEIILDVKVGAIPETGGSITADIQYRFAEALKINLIGAGSVSGLSYKSMPMLSDFNQISNCVVPTQTLALLPSENSLLDPFGYVTGCAGETLPDYTGFSVGIYQPDPNDPTGGVTGIVPLTETEFPDIPGNKIPIGLEPNRQNSNPYYLDNENQGKYNFLLDPSRGQTDIGRTYILMVNPPKNSIYSQRRIRFVIDDNTDNIIAYTATSLDGKPMAATDDRMTLKGTLSIEDAERVGLVLAVLNLQFNVCQSQEVKIIKTGDRAAAEPGDTVIYRLNIRNLASGDLENIIVTDTLPLGFQFNPNSVRARLLGNPVDVATTHSGSNVQFILPGILPTGQILNIAYAAVLTPDALRGTGRNSAIVNGKRTDNHRLVKDGPATHQMRLKPGILSDYGTIIGRVFVDKNFDGEQQPGEPGVPNAVILMDDGNRITTDTNGLFSISNVLPGYRTAVLDFTSIPGFTLAPNERFIERNSQSRLLHIAPGSMVRLNFAVSPVAKQEETSETTGEETP